MNEAFYVGVSWKAQKRLRQLLDFWFPDSHMGIRGDEDGDVLLLARSHFPSRPSTLILIIEDFGAEKFNII
jgi:hypothetical protein